MLPPLDRPWSGAERRDLIRRLERAPSGWHSHHCQGDPRLTHCDRVYRCASPWDYYDPQGQCGSCRAVDRSIRRSADLTLRAIAEEAAEERSIQQ